MSGEWSKRIGEQGENSVKRLLDLLGWAPLLANYDIPCSYPKDHGTSETGRHRRQHGLDGSFKYSCPLVDGTQQHAVVSVKYSNDRYPTEGKLGKKFGEYYPSLSQMCVCYERSPEYASLTAADDFASRFPVSGVLFWLNHCQEDDEASIFPALASTRPDADPVPTFIVDNHQAAFLYDSVAFIRRNYGASYYFNYQSTGKNLDSRTRRHKGSILPLQMLNSPEVVFRVESSEKILVICSKSAFSESDLKRLCDLAQILTLAWTTKVVIAFRAFDELREGQAATKVRQMFSGNDGLQGLAIHSLQDSFRREDPT